MTPASSPLSSPLSSVASRSPSLPRDYPSPPTSNDSEAAGTPRSRDAHDDENDPDGPPPAKRQRIMKPRDMKTEYLNLGELSNSDSEEVHLAQDAKLNKLLTALRTKRKIVVIAGAGISVSAGIPDFRSGKGLFKTLRTTHKLKGSGKQLFDASVYRDDSATSNFHTMVRQLSHLTKTAKPTAFHHMLATLAEEGRLMRLYSQNVDGIDTALEPLKTVIPLSRKGPWPKTIQLHGGLEKMVCQKCGHLEVFDGSLFDGPEPPPCPECATNDEIRRIGGLRGHGVGKLRPRMVLYNEFNPDEEAIGAVSAADLKSRPDAVIVVGTTLKVPGIRRLAKELCAVARDRRDGFTAWINCDPEPPGVEFKDSWDMVIQGESDEVARLLSLPRFDDKDCGEWTTVKPELVRELSARPEVVLESKIHTAIRNEGILTPIDSPREQTPTPAPKMKQPTLSFANTKTPVLEKKENKPRKKLPGKKLSTKPVMAANSITKTFTTTKKTTTTQTEKRPVGRPRKLSPGANFPGLQAGWDKNVEMKPQLPLPKTSNQIPTSSGLEILIKQMPQEILEIRNSFSEEDSVSIIDSKESTAAPEKVIRNSQSDEGTISFSSSSDTISPKSKPFGMHHLIS